MAYRPQCEYRRRGFLSTLFDRKNTSNINCYQVHIKVEARYDHILKTGCFGSKILYNPFTHNLVLCAQFESIDDESDTEDDITKTPTSKKAVMMVMKKWPSLM